MIRDVVEAVTGHGADVRERVPQASSSSPQTSEAEEGAGGTAGGVDEL